MEATRSVENEYRDVLNKVLDDFSRKLAETIYYASILAKHLPEIEAAERGDAKLLKNKDAIKFLKEHSKNSNVANIE